MRNVFFLFIALALITACSKDEFNPLKPKHGQKVELFLDHYRDVNDQRAFLLADKTPAPLSLREFNERSPGYSYKVTAKVVVSKEDIQDGPNTWFELDDVISKEKYAGGESFEIALIAGDLFGSYLSITEHQGQLLYGNLFLSPTNEVIKQQLESYIHENERVRIEATENKDGEEYYKYQEYLRKLVLKAVVTHDPENYGKGYMVHGLKFNE